MCKNMYGTCTCVHVRMYWERFLKHALKPCVLGFRSFFCDYTFYGTTVPWIHVFKTRLCSSILEQKMRLFHG